MTESTQRKKGLGNELSVNVLKRNGMFRRKNWKGPR